MTGLPLSVDLERIFRGNIPVALLALDNIEVIGLCECWNHLSGFQRQHIIEKVWPGSYGPAFSHALAGENLTMLTDRSNGMHRLSDDRMREVIRILREEDLAKFI